MTGHIIRSVSRTRTLAAAVLLWSGSAAIAKSHAVGGCVKDERGAPVRGAIVYVEEVEGEARYNVAADAKGCYRLEQIPDGYFEVRAEVNGTVLARRQVALERAGSVTVDLQFAPKAAPGSTAEPPMINLKMLADRANSRNGSQGSALATRESLIQSITFQPEIANAGEPVMGTLALTKRAPGSGVPVQLSVNNSALASVPPELTVKQGEMTASFPITTTRMRSRHDLRVIVRVSDGAGSASAELRIRSYTRVTVRMSGPGFGRVVSTPEGMSCISGICTSSFADGEGVQLRAEPNPGTQFAGWSGDCDGKGKVVVSGPMTCVAEFK